MPVIRNQYYLFVCALAVIPGGLVSAENEEAIARCARIASAGERILCLEDALRGGSASSDEVAGVHTAPEPIGPVPDAVLAPAAAAATQQVAASSVAAVTPEARRDVTTKSKAAPAKQLGSEQIGEKKKAGRSRAARISATIVSVEVVGPGGRLRFKLDNGQIWRQTGDDDRNIRRRLKGAAYHPVEMWRSRTGGYRMRITSIDRTVKVKRLK